MDEPSDEKSSADFQNQTPLNTSERFNLQKSGLFLDELDFDMNDDRVDYNTMFLDLLQFYTKKSPLSHLHNSEV